MTHILVDTANTFFRARHVIRGDTSEKIGMAIHIMFNSIKKAWQDFDGSHVVFCLEGRSFRKDLYAPYKRNRKEMAEGNEYMEKKGGFTYSVLDGVFWEAGFKTRYGGRSEKGCELTLIAFKQEKSDEEINKIAGPFFLP